MKPVNDEKLSLVNLGGGAAVEQFDAELQRVLDNIVDPNTSETKMREITLKVKFKPKERNYSQMLIECTAKLSASDPYATNAYIGADIRGRAEAFEHNPEQLKLAFEQRQKEQQEQVQEPGNVTHIRKEQSK